MNDEEKKSKQKDSSFLSNIKIILQKTFFCCPTFFEPTKYYLDLGPIPQYDDSNFKKTLVLDIDKTLICSTLENANDYDFTIEFKYHNIPFVYKVYKRPGLDEFLNYVKKNFEVVIFTASVRDHADPVIDKIAPWVPSSHRFYRKDCMYINSYFIKDLERLNRPLSSIIIIDDSPASFSYHASNGILVSSFEGDKRDRELTHRIMPLLKKLEIADDVREIIKKYK